MLEEIKIAKFMSSPEIKAGKIFLQQDVMIISSFTHDSLNATQNSSHKSIKRKFKDGIATVSVVKSSNWYSFDFLFILSKA